MASVRKIRTLKNGTAVYLVRWRDLNGKQCQGTIPGYDAAHDFADGIEREKRQGTYVDPAIGQKTTVKVYGERWIARKTKRRRASTAANYERVLRLHLYPYIGHRGMATIRTEDINDVIDGLLETLSVSSTKTCIATIASMFKSAVAAGLIPKNPCADIERPDEIKKNIIIPTVKQVKKIASHDGLDERYRALITLGAMTGMRRNELLAITLDTLQIRFPKKVITIRPDLGQLVITPGKSAKLGPPKSPAAARDVPIGNGALAVLKAHMKAFPPNPKDGFGGLIFTCPSGDGPVAQSTLSGQLAPAFASVGFPVRTGMHLLRHQYVAGCIAMGATVIQVQRWVGHESAVTTLNTYGHLWPDSDDVARVAIDELWGYPVEHASEDKDDGEGDASVVALH